MEQRAEMIRLEDAGTCIFCPGHLASNPERNISFQTEWWSVTENKFPYPDARVHLLLIPTLHVSDLLDLPDAARTDLWVALDRARQAHGLDFYGLGVRCGDCRFTGGTIAHLHIHVIAGDVDDPGHQPVSLKLSSRPDSDMQAQARNVPGKEVP
ncbi:HIT family protein [Streptomyces violascens]|uniref:HIT family protein n=1 Tax=Streptomyces violascens TaxID=67381 RepID=UPI0036C16F0B